MTEPAYIALVFDSEYCVCFTLALSSEAQVHDRFCFFQVCGNSPAPLLIPQLKMRLCAKCKSKQWASLLGDMWRLFIFLFSVFNGLMLGLSENS